MDDDGRAILGRAQDLNAALADANIKHTIDGLRNIAAAMSVFFLLKDRLLNTLVRCEALEQKFKTVADINRNLQMTDESLREQVKLATDARLALEAVHERATKKLARLEKIMKFRKAKKLGKSLMSKFKRRAKP
jgi:hypothetical protein